MLLMTAPKKLKVSIESFKKCPIQKNTYLLVFN